VDPEELWRAALHDFNNLLAGVQGVLDLSDPRLPLDGRNRLRLEATLEDGKTLIAMARALALGRHPDPGLLTWFDWKAGLNARLEPLAALFRCPIELVDMGADGVSWPSPLLQEWAAAFTRQILPWVAPGPLRLEAKAAKDAWYLTWVGDAPLPVALRSELPLDAPKSLPAYWLRSTGERLGLSIRETPRGLEARMERSVGS
jgi:hypothetical protein